MVQTQTSPVSFPIHETLCLETMSDSAEQDSLIGDGEVNLKASADDVRENGVPRTRRRTTSGNSHLSHVGDTVTTLYESPCINGPVQERDEDDKGKDMRNRIAPPRSRRRAFVTVAVLTLINLLNYMDRFTIAGVLGKIQYFYSINNTESGLLQTAFICSYMVFSPVFGYLGDRYNRKYIMCVGIFFWSGVTLAGSFIPGDHFWAFISLRGLVGVGEASYSTIAPTVIADLFAKELRTKALAVFYFAIPVGSGLGYILGSNVAEALGSWHWALRVTPGAGVICCILILTVVYEPPRGESEGGVHLTASSWLTDLKELAKNKSFMFSSIGFTCVAFVTGALAFWAPLFMEYSIHVLEGEKPDSATVSLIFGAITCVAGFVGVGVGAESARRYRHVNPRADPLVCAFGLLTCTPFLFLALVTSKYNTMATWALIFVGETLLCLNWSIVADILLYIVIPTRRSTAEAFQILMSHAFGDAGSPYVIGQVSDAVAQARGDDKSPAVQYVSLQYALYCTAFVAVLGGASFLMTALFIQRDKRKAEMIIKGQPQVIDGSSNESLMDGDVNFVGTQSTLVQNPEVA